MAKRVEIKAKPSNPVESMGLLGLCLVCGRRFKPWRDDFDELIKDECFSCDQSLEIGSLMDRNLVG